MKLVKEMPRFLGLQPDVDWQHYSAFTTSAKWQGLVTEQRIEAFDSPGPSGMAISSWVILPVYQSASDPSWFWSSPDQGQFPPDAMLSGEFRRAARVRAGRDTACPIPAPTRGGLADREAVGGRLPSPYRIVYSKLTVRYESVYTSPAFRTPMSIRSGVGDKGLGPSGSGREIAAKPVAPGKGGAFHER